jgi:hypothetical protein
MSERTPVDAVVLREEVSRRSIATLRSDPATRTTVIQGRPMASRLGYDGKAVDALPDEAVEAFAGTAICSRCET